MRVNAISNVYTRLSRNNNNHIIANRNIQNDYFVRAKEISFGSKTPEQKTMNKFQRVARKYYLEQPFDIEKMNNETRSFVKDLTITSMDEAPMEFRDIYNYAGLFLSVLELNEETGNIRYAKDSNKLFLSTPDSNTKVEYYSNAVHEFSHYLQTKDKETSEAEFANEYMKKHKCDDETAKNSIEISSTFAADIANILSKPLNKAMNDIDLTGKIINNFKNGNILQYAYSLQGIDNIDKFISSTFNEVSKDYQNRDTSYDMDYLRDFAIFHFKNELEAYTNGYSALCKEIPSYKTSVISWTERARLDLYKKMSNLPIKKRWKK